MIHSLPQLAGDRMFLADGGLETTLVFHHGMELPEFAAFPLLGTDAGRALLQEYFRGYLALARDLDAGFLLDTVTWRANRDWGARLGYDVAALDRVNRASVAFAGALRDEAPEGPFPILVNGVVGPRGDGYAPTAAMAAGEAQAYHAAQVGAIEPVDAEAVGSVAYYMINCAHPSHFAATLASGGDWRERIAGLRPNASVRSHAELDAADE